MDNETFIDKLIYTLENEKIETVNSRIDALIAHGKYLNEIPKDYQETFVKTLSEAIVRYCLDLTSYYLFRNKRPNNHTTTQPPVLINQDIKTLEKARKIIHEKIYCCHFHLRGADIPTIKIPTQEDREKYNNEYKATLELYADTSKAYIIEDAKDGKKIFDTFCNLTDMINDLKEKRFEIFSKNTYYTHTKPNKNKIRELLKKVRLQFNLHSSLDEKQLLDDL